MVIDECNRTLQAIIQDMGRIQTIPWGDEKDEKNTPEEDR